MRRRRPPCRQRPQPHCAIAPGRPSHAPIGVRAHRQQRPLVEKAQDLIRRPGAPHASQLSLLVPRLAHFTHRSPRKNAEPSMTKESIQVSIKIRQNSRLLRGASQRNAPWACLPWHAHVPTEMTLTHASHATYTVSSDPTSTTAPRLGWLRVLRCSLKLGKLEPGAPASWSREAASST